MVWTMRRRAARVIPIDAAGRVLMISGRDPVDRTQEPWWEIPGGGIDGSEAPADAVRRELAEEAGILHAEIGPALWTQDVTFTFSGIRFEQHETIFSALVPEPDQLVAPRLEALEALAMGERRWWDGEELLASPVRVLPERLRDFLPGALAGLDPGDPPHLDLR